jgi:hypothetical protein
MYIGINRQVVGSPDVRRDARGVLLKLFVHENVPCNLSTVSLMTGVGYMFHFLPINY